VSQIRQVNLKSLPVLTKQHTVIGNRCSQNSQSLDRAITRKSQTHDVDVCGAEKAYNCWKYALEAIINWLLLYFLVHDNRLLFML